MSLQDKLTDFNQKGKVSVVLGGQFGSEAKGLLAGLITTHSAPDIIVTNNAPNSGHTTVREDGSKFVGFHIPTAAMFAKHAPIYLDAGAAIDIDMLAQEIKDLQIDPERITIHPRAVVIEDEDVDYEKNKNSGAAQIAGTQKGVGSAYSRKLRREANTATDYAESDGSGKDWRMKAGDYKIKVGRLDLTAMLNNGMSATLEVPQGFSLSLNAGLQYPNCTSRDCTVNQALSDANIHPRFLGKVAAALRTFPIRVGNLMDGDNRVGYSGDCYHDQKEVTFEEIGVEPELTTVTKRVRRIFTWSPQQFNDMICSNYPDLVFLNFVNYLKTKQQFDEIIDSMHGVARSNGCAPSIVFGLGPKISDVVSSYDEVCRLKGW